METKGQRRFDKLDVLMAECRSNYRGTRKVLEDNTGAMVICKDR